MTKKRRVVVTGLGTVNPLGMGARETFHRLCAGLSGVRAVARFDVPGMRTRVGGEVRDFTATDFLPEKIARRTDKFQQFALASAHMAMQDARLEITSANACRVGTIIGTAYGGIETMASGHGTYLNGGCDDISPFFAAMILPGMAAGQVAMRFGAKGQQGSPTTACAAGTNAIGDSFKLIQMGVADAMIAGGAEAALIPVLTNCFGVMGATTARTVDPEKASRPFDAERDGFVPSEGAGVIILEELEFALQRGARIYAEVVGTGATADAYHVTSPAPGGEGAARCIRMALKDAGLKPEEIDYINAHGTSTRLNDSTETEAIKAVFGDHARCIPVSSNKSMLGHTMGASGAIEAIYSVLTITEGIIPPTINLDTPDPECDLDYVPNLARKAKVKTVVSNSFGFGGVNGVIIVRDYRTG